MPVRNLISNSSVPIKVDLTEKHFLAGHFVALRPKMADVIELFC